MSEAKDGTRPPIQPPNADEPDRNARAAWRVRLHEIIFEADTPAGWWFDVGLLVAIVASVVVVMLDSVASIRAEHGRTLLAAEWFFTLLFTVEYILRLLCVRRPASYALSFFGIVDLLSILPTYLSVLIPGAQGMVVIRSLRLLRLFRVLKLTRFVGEARQLRHALAMARTKITVFLSVVVTVVVIAGALMYIVEGDASGFTSIPRSMYWAVVTMTTVGYGDIAPVTPLGQFIAALMMILGYALIVVPTGIVSAEIAEARRGRRSTQHCSHCGLDDHELDAVFCRRCGDRL
ncbi:MAG: ion transporter [Phycisphaerales bacterium]|nr:ion transporter [Phycisphaerales bacterium]